MAKTHFSEITGRIRLLNTPPSDPLIGDMFYDLDNNSLFRYTGNTWIGFKFTGTAVLPYTSAGNPNGTHFSALASSIRDQSADPTSPIVGDWYYDTDNDNLKIYVHGAWYAGAMTTTTSTSTSTTSTSTSTTSTSSSTSSSSSTSTSTSTSTTTTL